jgi:HEXXH motif-containing protein
MSNLWEQIRASFANLNNAPWFPDLTNALVAQKWKEMGADMNLTVESYGTTRILRHSVDAPRRIIAVVNSPQSCCAPSVFMEDIEDELADLYRNVGVRFYATPELKTSTILCCLQEAFSILGYINGVKETVESLIRSLHVIKPRDRDHDISFSEPHIPFSVFVSVAKKRIAGDALRLAESILHEAMHLQLTLVEGIAPLIKSRSNRYFSPWRGEMRDAEGILHGLYVFTVLEGFFRELQKLRGLDQFSQRHIQIRRSEIQRQIAQLDSFRTSNDLTEIGELLRQHCFRT